MAQAKYPDQLAELYVASLFVEAGWNLYFPHRDDGVDFIATKKNDAGEFLIRSVQVGGKYPTLGKKDKDTYGIERELSVLHADMVLAIPFFSSVQPPKAELVAYMPIKSIKKHATKGYHCKPASFKNGKVQARRDYKKYFNTEGLKLVEASNWSDAQ